METIEQIASTIRVVKEGKTHKAAPHITDGLVASKTPTRTGLVELTPQQALSIRVERVAYNGQVTGYQRMVTNLPHVRKIANAVIRGESIDPVTLGLDGGFLYAVDGHNRILAHIIARKPIRAIIEPMTYKERAARFAAQRFTQKLTADNLVLASNDKIANYIKDAIASEAHVWHPLVGLTGSPRHLSPSAAYDILVRYTLGIVGMGGSLGIKMDSLRIGKADLRDAPELSTMLLAIGTKQSNPLAYRPATIRALTDVAVMAVVRGNKNRNPLIERWCRHMPTFDWHAYAWATRMADIRPPLIAHWNKRLSPAQKISG